MSVKNVDEGSDPDSFLQSQSKLFRSILLADVEEHTNNKTQQLNMDSRICTATGKFLSSAILTTIL